MDSKKTPKADLESRKINFFLIGAIVALTLSWLAIDGMIFVTAKAKAVAATSVAVEEVMDDEVPNTEEEEQQEEEEEQPEEQPEEEEQEMEDLEQEITTTEEKVETNVATQETNQNEVITHEEVAEVKPLEKEDDGDEEIVLRPAVKAAFPGGNAELYKWLGKNVEYPKAAREFNIQGTVVVQFVVEKNGSVSQAKIMSSAHETLDEEALRLVSSMPKWSPAKNNGEACRSYFVLPIQFNLQ